MVDGGSWHTPDPAGPAEALPGNRPVAARRRPGALFARLALSVGVLILLVVASHPLWLAPLLNRHLTATSGRTVHFDSVTIGLSGSLAPVVHLRGVHVDNASWTGSRAPFAALAEAVFVFAWRRFEGRHAVTYLLLRQGEVHLERSADGLRNWRLSEPQDRGPGKYSFFGIEAHDLRLGFIHRGIDLDVNTAASDSAPSKSASGDVLRTRIDVDGSFRKLAFRGSVATGPVLSFQQSDGWFGLRGHAAIDGVDLDADGRAANLFRAPRIDAHAVLDGRSLAALRPLVGDRYAEPRAFHIEGRVQGADSRYALSDMKAKVGGTDLAGDLAGSGNGPRHAVRAHLRSESADASDLLWLAGRRPESGARAPATPIAAKDHDAFAALRDFDADLAFDAAHFHAAGLRALQSLKLKATLADGRLEVRDLDVGWGGGFTRGRLTLDLRQPLASAEAALDTSGVRIESLLPAAEAQKRITGTLHGKLTLKASGNTIEALRASAAGSGELGLRDGTISSLLDAEMGLEGGKLVRTVLSGNDALPLPCAAMTFDVNAGRARLADIVVDSANTRTGGSGTIDLRDGAIDLVLTPQPKRPGLFELQRSIRFLGRLPKPQRALVDRVEPPAGTACTTAHP